MAVLIKSHKATDIFAPFSPELHSQFVAGHSDDDPLTTWRKAGFSRALATAPPTNRDEDFKYVNFRLLDFEGLSPTRLIASENGNGKAATLMTMTTGGTDILPTRFKIDDNEIDDYNNIFFGILAKNGRAVPKEVTEYLEFIGERFPPRKFTSLAHAFLGQGAFLRVGKGCDHASPRQLLTRISSGGVIVSAAALVMIEENACGSLIWDIESESTASGFVNNTIDVIVKNGGRMKLLVNQESSSQVSNVMTMRVYLENDAELELVTMNTGGRLNLMEIDLQFAGQGSRATVNGVYLGQEDENFNLLTHQDHHVGNSTSDLLYLGTLAGKSKSNYLGKITIAPNAKRSNAYQKNRNLALNRGVSINSSPKLVIRANDVRCTHGATTSRISDLEMFYLRSRGIDKARAKMLLAAGFLRQVSERINSPVLRQGFDRRLEGLLLNWNSDES